MISSLLSTVLMNIFIFGNGELSELQRRTANGTGLALVTNILDLFIKTIVLSGKYRRVYFLYRSFLQLHFAII